MKYIISVIIFLLIASGGLGYGYYRHQRQELESKNEQISKLESQISDLQSKIQKLNDANNSLQQEKKELSDKIAAKKKRIDQLEKVIAENKLNIPKQTSAEKSSGKDTPAETGSDAADKNINKEDGSGTESSSLWYWIIFAAVLVMTSATVAIFKMQKKPAPDACKNKKFICPSCGWEYRKPATECENCKTKF